MFNGVGGEERVVLMFSITITIAAKLFSNTGEIKAAVRGGRAGR